MARLFSRMSAGAVDDPVHGHFEPDADGGFNFPDQLSDHLHSVHIRKKRAWETEMERDERRHGEESARRRDPETLYNAVSDIANITRQLAALQLGAVPAVSPDADVAALTAEVEMLRAQLAEAAETGVGSDADSTDDSGDDAETGDDVETGDDDATAKKPSRSRKAAPAGA
jgi:hypothetical protein